MLITWDEQKNKSNSEKHGVWFEEAQTVIVNPESLMALNHHFDRDRMEYLGFSLKGRVLYVVTVEETDEEIRIVSARKATSFERSGYEQKR